MKKKIFLMLTLVFILACVFAISVSAETSLKPQATNAYGELSFFDESISVGRIKTNYGFTPYMDAEGTTYARIVVGDGTTFYTFPTAYALSNTAIYGSGQKSIMVLDFASLNSAMQTATGTNPNWGKANIYRIELPKNMQYLNAGNQNFQSCTNVIEIYLQPESTLKDTGKNMVFWKCHNLETIHNLDSFVFRNGSLGGAFQECRKLTNITIGVSTEVTTTGDNMFNGCTNLQSVNLKEAFPNLTTIGSKAFYSCNNLKKISSESEDYTFVMADSVTTVGGNAFDGCKLLETVYVGKNVATLSYDAFRNCTNLETIYVTGKIVSISGNTFKDTNNVKTIYYVGTKANAESFVSTAKSSGGNNVIGTLTLISYSDYKALENKDGLYLIYDYNYCEAYNSGAHEPDPEKSNACVIFCNVCKDTIIKHAKDAEIAVKIEYTNYTQAGLKITYCKNTGCTYGISEDTSALFACLGYSAPENGNAGISIGFTVNNRAIAEYKEITGADVKYGVFAASSDKLGNGDIFENGTANANAICAEINTTEFAVFDLKITGFTDAQKDALLALGAYVSVTKDGATEYSYMQDSTKGTFSGKYYFASFNDILGTSSTNN